MAGVIQFLGAAALAITAITALGQTGEPARLWAIQPPDEVVEYDLTTFAMIRTVKIPPLAVAEPRRLTINHRGQILAQLEDTVWLWDAGKPVRTFSAGASRSEVLDVSVTVAEVSPSWLLSGDGTNLFVARNIFRRVLNASVDHYAFTRFQVLRTDLSGKEIETIVDDEFRQCECATGVCSDTCPQGLVSAPGRVIDDSFLVTHWIPGLREPEFQESSLFRKTGSIWSDSPLPQPIRSLGDLAAAIRPVSTPTLLVENGRLTIVEVTPNRRRQTPIRVRSSADAFLAGR